MNSDEANVPQVLPRRPVVGCAPEQVSWLSDRPTPRAFPASRPVALAGFVPDYSDGGAAAFNRLPWARRGAPGRELRGNGSGIADAPPRGGGAGARGGRRPLLRGPHATPL